MGLIVVKGLLPLLLSVVLTLTSSAAHGLEFIEAAGVHASPPITAAHHLHPRPEISPHAKPPGGGGGGGHRPPHSLAKPPTSLLPPNSQPIPGARPPASHPSSRPAPSAVPPHSPVPVTYRPAPPPLYTLPPLHHPLRSFFSVQGVVYCKSCNYSNKGPLQGATPLLGAFVKLNCNNSKYHQSPAMASTDKNGYFKIRAPKTVTTFGSHRCRVSLFSSPPAAKCGFPTDLNGGLKGAVLSRMEAPQKPKPGETSKHPHRALFSVGPFAFVPKCHR